MKPTPPSSVLVQLNEEATEVLVLVDVPGTSGGKSLVLSTIRLSDCRDKGDCNEILGKVILDSLLTFTGRETEDTSQEAQLLALVRGEALGGNASAMWALVGLLETSALRDRDSALLEEVESWYQELAKRGDNDAARKLSDSWPRHKNLLLDMILRGN